MTNTSPSKEIVGLIIACLYDIADKQQQEQLERWLEESEMNRDFYAHLKDSTYRKTALQEYASYDSRQAWPRVAANLYPHKKSVFRKLWPYAALLILGLGIAGVRLLRDAPASSPLVAVQADIVPGKAKARLILPDGKAIDLEAAGSNVPKNIAGEYLVNDGEKLVYADQPAGNAMKMHTLQIPRGGEYNLVLADGTKVWLNAESELKYLDHFTGGQREVELSGEAYFEVAKDSVHPFHVLVGDLKVKVLGTSFNIHAYSNGTHHTTLAEGKIMLDYKGQSLKMYPGEQATVTPDGLKVAKVKIINYTGWKDQRFVYADKSLEEVLKDLERWYDVEISIGDENVRRLQFTANLPKYENIDNILRIIECAACVKFEIKGRVLNVRTVR